MEDWSRKDPPESGVPSGRAEVSGGKKSEPRDVGWGDDPDSG